jgi:hypothetical protein
VADPVDPADRVTDELIAQFAAAHRGPRAGASGEKSKQQ